MTTTKQYDYLNRLKGISSSSSSSSSFSYAYNQANQRTQVTNTDTSYWSYQYDKLGQVISGKKYWANGTPVAGQQFTYNFDDIGNRQSTATGGNPTGANLRPANYTANNLNQYTSRDVPGFAEITGSATPNATITVNLQRAVRQGSYFWDELAVSNTSSAQYLSLTNLAVLNNGTNADIVATNVGNLFLPQTPETFGYDADGNMTNSGRWTITWDAENRAISFASLATSPLASQRKVDCAYDFQGRRVQKIVSTNNGAVWIPVSTNKFIYDGWNLAGIFDGNNNLLNSFTWGSDLSGSLQGAGGVGGLLSMTVYTGANAGTYDYTYDGNGNVASIISVASGTVAGQWEYGPFGEVIRATGTMAKANPFRFSTKCQDDETSLCYYGYRYYDPILGRWLSRDPSEEDGGENLYGFVSNDPIDENDTLGLFSNGTPVGGGSLGTVDRAKADGCCYMISVLVDKTGVPYNGTGQQLANAIVDKGVGIGHAWVRLIDTIHNTDEYHGHTGAETPDHKDKYTIGLRALQGRHLPKWMVGDPFADINNPGYYLQKVFDDGRDHLSNPGHRPNFEGTFCISEQQFNNAKAYIAQYDFQHYGGFYAGCGYFAAGVLDASGLGNYQTTARFDHKDLPDSVAYHLVLGHITVTHVRIATPGTPNYYAAKEANYVFPDALADQIGSLTPKARVFYKAP